MKVCAVPLHPENPFPHQLQSALDLVRLVATGKCVCAGIAGPPGLGKTHLVERILTECRVQYEIVDGSAAGLLTKAYELRKGGVIVLDDADSLMTGGGTTTANLMKRLLLDKPKRLMVCETIKAQEDKGLVPARFETEVGVVWITNVNVNNPRNVKPAQRDHFDAILSRLRPVELTAEPHWVLDYILHLCVDEQLLRNMGLTLAASQDVVNFLCANAWNFRELSVRSTMEIAKLRRELPNAWQGLARRLINPIARSTLPLPIPPRIVSAAARKIHGFAWQPSVIILPVPIAA